MKKPISRRSALQRAALASALPLVASAQAPQQGQAPAPARGGAGRGMPQGGRGPIRVLVVTKGHPFQPWDDFFAVFNSLGGDITWTHVEQPAASVFFNPDLAKNYDVFCHYDWADAVIGAGTPPGQPLPGPSPEINNNLRNLLRQGKGFVFFHHAIASWNNWPEYKEVQGAAADWGRPITIRGKQYPKSGYLGNTKQIDTVIDKSHPVVAGLPETFEIVDETYLCPIFEDSIHVLVRTDFKPTTKSWPDTPQWQNWPHPDGSNAVVWVKTAENSPIAYIQHGHGSTAWANEHFRKLMGNAIKWTASKEAMDWAKKNPSKIWKS